MLNFLIYTLYKILRVICSLSSRKINIQIGILFGRFIKLLSKKRYQITFDNLEKAFPEKSFSEIKDITEKCYDNLGITFIEILTLDKISKNDLENIIKYENIELINELYKNDQGLILLSGHFGNWEYLAYSAGYYSDHPVNIVVKPQSNKYLDKEINKIRTSHNNKVFASKGAAREMIDLIREKKVIALLTDQSAGREAPFFTEFFGRMVPTFDAPARIALKYKVPMIIGFAVRDENYNYSVELKKIDHSDLINDNEGIQKLTDRYIQTLESEIRKHPHMWAWQHRRWKHAK